MSVSGADGRVEPAGSGPAADGGFGVVYVAADGTERRVSLAALAAVRLEDGRPVRSFPSYRGQRNYPGWYWSATMGRRVGFESWVERDHLVALDFDPAVTAVASQPFWLLWRAGDKMRRHAPDFFARLAGGGALVVDSRPLDRIGERDREAFAAAGEACARLGWQYAVWGSAGPVPAANLRWLAGYRHPRCHDEPVAGGLREAFARPRALMDGAEVAGDPLATLPVLFHLMWVMNWPRTCRWCSATAASSARPGRRAGMAERPGVLRVGDRVLFGGGEHQVVGLAGNAVRLLAVSGQAAVVALPFLLAAPDFAIVGTGTAAAGLAPRLAPQGLLDGLPEHVARAARDWERHLIEVLTGVPPDAPDGAAPRPEYDLARPLAERERAKAAELTAAGVKASARTVRRMRYRYREEGLWCRRPDHRRLGGHRVNTTKSQPMLEGRQADSLRRRQRVIAALDRAAADGTKISVCGIARAAGVDRTFLYRHRDLLEKIHALQAEPAIGHSAGPAVTRASLQADLLAAHERAIRLNTRIQHLERRLSEALGDQAWRESGLGPPTDIDALTQKITHLEQQILDLRLQLQERDEDLAAARATNRDLMTQLNHAARPR